MLVLASTTDKIRVVLGGAHTTNPLRCYAAYTDATSTSSYGQNSFKPWAVPGRTFINTNGATAVNVVGSPAASTYRTVYVLSVYNSDTVTQTVTVEFTDNATEYVLASAALATGERIEYESGSGFRVFSASGQLKTV